MRTRILLAAPMLLALLALAPASQPTSQPAKAVSFESVVKRLPKNLQPPKGQEWTDEEAKAAGQWVCDELRKVGRVSFTSDEFDYTGGGEKHTAVAKSAFFTVANKAFRLDAELSLTADGNIAASKDRKKTRRKVNGHIQSSKISPGASGMGIYVMMNDVSVD